VCSSCLSNLIQVRTTSYGKSVKYFTIIAWVRTQVRAGVNLNLNRNPNLDPNLIQANKEYALHHKSVEEEGEGGKIFERESDRERERVTERE
jgi:hypothetical protein